MQAKRGLNQNHLAFCKLIAEGATLKRDAYARCFPRGKASAASASATVLLRHPLIKAEIERLQSLAESQVAYNIHQMREDLLEVKRRCMEPNAKMRGVGKDRKQVEAVSVDPETGEVTKAGVFEFEASGANRAIELLGKSMGAFPNRLELSTPSGLQVESIQYDMKLLTKEERKEFRRLMVKATPMAAS